jgi:hypothetical protein
MSTTNANTATNALPPPPPPTVYAHVLPHPKHKGKVTPETWQSALQEFSLTSFARQSMRDVWQWEQGNKANIPGRVATPKPTIADRECDWCAATFTPRNNRQLRCSKKCSNAHAQANRSRKNPLRVSVCAAPGCGAKFTTTDCRKVYCSERCNKRKKYQAKKQKAGVTT